MAPGNLWREVESEIPGAHAAWDDDGREARRFGALTSGYTLLYGAKGDLLFKRGVTGSRGYEGGNIGIDQLRASIDTGRPAPRGALVFGCALADAGAPPAGEEQEDLYQAQDRGEPELYFQPLVARDGQLTGFEALLRWTHPEHGAIRPSDCIPLAGKSGLIVAIGDWILREACRICKTWQRPGQRPLRVAVNVSPISDRAIPAPATGQRPLRMAVNVSAIQFELPDFPERVAHILDEYAMDPGLLTLELTEGTLLRDLELTRHQLDGLRASGIRISLDDFGTGYSSLSYLAALPADTIKLDHSFANRDFGNTSAVLESVIEMAHRVGLQMIGEGVKTRSKRPALRHGLRRITRLLLQSADARSIGSEIHRVA